MLPVPSHRCPARFANTASPAPRRLASARATTFSAYDVVFRPASAPRSLRGHGTTATLAVGGHAVIGDAATTNVGGASPLPEVVEFYRMSGETDYLLKVVVKDIAAYDAFYKRLIAAAPLQDVSSSFAMEQIKLTTALPI